MSVKNNFSVRGYLPKSEKININYYPESEGKSAFYATNVSVKRDYKTKEGDVIYDNLPMKAFGSTAKFLGEYAKRGDQVHLIGEIHVGDNYEKDGKVVYGTPYLHVLAADIVGGSQGEKQEVKAQDAPPPNPFARLKK